MPPRPTRQGGAADLDAPGDDAVGTELQEFLPSETGLNYRTPDAAALLKTS